jgi:thymidylate kinase
MRTIVLCLEGCHGSGKTELCNAFQRLGVEILDEAFLAQPEYALHPQSLVMETYWVAHWFQRLLKRHHELAAECQKTGEKFRILVADRSPFSAVFYARYKGFLLENVIRAQIEELKAHAAIDLYTVHVNVDRDLLWERIQDRLRQQPERQRYNEQSYAWFEETVMWYEGFQWDMAVENNQTLPEEAIQRLLRMIEPRLRQLIENHHEQTPALERLLSPVKC